MSLPSDVDLTRWEPAVDRKGRPVKPGDRVRARRHPRGTVTGTLQLSERAWVQDGREKIGALVIVDEEGRIYDAPSSLLRLQNAPT